MHIEYLDVSVNACKRVIWIAPVGSSLSVHAKTKFCNTAALPNQSLKMQLK